MEGEKMEKSKVDVEVHTGCVFESNIILTFQFGSRCTPPLYSMVCSCRKPNQDRRGLAWESGYCLRRGERDGRAVLD